MNINNVENLVIKYNVDFSSLEGWLELLENRYLKQEEPHKEKSEPINKITLTPDVVIPDEEYIRKIIKELSKLKDILGDWEYQKCKDGLTEILNHGDFDDAEEIMNTVHELIKKYVYGSDTKISYLNWGKCEEYIEKTGYVPIPVCAGDSVRQFREYFDRPIEADGGIPGTIKQIQLKPYSLKFYDGEEIREDLKLRGKCTYYK